MPSSNPNLKSLSANNRACAIELASSNSALSIVIFIFFITIYFWFPFYLFFVTFPCFLFPLSVFPLFSVPPVLTAHLYTSSICVHCTVISAEVPVRTVLDIDLCLVTAGYEAVMEQLHVCVSWCYLLSPFLTERGHQTPGGPDVMSEHEVPRGTMC